jgi:hypothetical protein
VVIRLAIPFFIMINWEYKHSGAAYSFLVGGISRYVFCFCGNDCVKNWDSTVDKKFKRFLKL